MNTRQVMRAWGSILKGRKPLLSIEITRECPLRCPGCYAYEDDHLGNGINLRQLADKKGDSLVRGVLELVDQYRPLHVSLVGGDPLVRYREVTALLPLLSKRGIYTQVVTSAFREIPAEWASVPGLNISVSVDGLQPEHDARRKPATYARILKNIRGHRVTIHCTITAQMMQRQGYLQEFVEFWSSRPEVKRIWMSIFTPQKGDSLPEILTPDQRVAAVNEMLRLRNLYSKLQMSAQAIREFLTPPQSPAQCVFAQTTRSISADLKTLITPCQFGGNPDCSQCGCLASVGFAAVARQKLALGLTAGKIFEASVKIGNLIGDMEERPASSPSSDGLIGGADSRPVLR